MYDQDHPKLAHNALPIKDPDVISFIKQTDSQNFIFNALQDVNLREKFLTEYFKWVSKSTLNQLRGLQNFKNLSFVHGTSQTFDLMPRTTFQSVFPIENSTSTIQSFSLTEFTS